MPINLFNKLEVNPLHQSILDAFGSIYKAVQVLGYSKGQIYLWIKKGRVNDAARKKIKAVGYSPDDFTKL